MTDSDGNTPLHYASYSGDIEVCKLLIAAGADVNKKNEEWLRRLRRDVTNFQFPIHVRMIMTMTMTVS